MWPAILRGAEAQARALAFFTRSSRTWTCPPLKEEDAAKFRALAAAHGFTPDSLLPHGTYLSNLASADAAVRARSIEAVIDEARRCVALGAAGYNFHPGSAGVGASPAERAAACARVASAINEVHAAVPAVRIVIENMAGQGGSLCGSLVELAAIIAGVADKARVGVCIDTAHAHGAGLDVSSAPALARLLDDFDAAIGLPYLRGMHLNDSKVPLGARKDRHENIGRGHVGIEGFRAVMNEPRLAGIPLILETPCPAGSDGVGIYKAEIAMLYALQGTSAGDPVVLPPRVAGAAGKGKGKGKGKKRAGEEEEEEDGGDSAEDEEVQEVGAGASSSAAAAASSSSSAAPAGSKGKGKQGKRKGKAAAAGEGEGVEAAAAAADASVGAGGKAAKKARKGAGKG